MKNVLSQDEIDSLINALASGEISNIEEEPENEIQKAKVYDFRRPNKLSKDQIQTIRGIHDNYARIISNYLSNQVRNTVKLSIVSIEQVTFGEFIRSIPNPTILGIFSVEPLDGICLLELNPTFCLFLIDLLCGGAMTRQIKMREFTDIEMTMLKDILHIMIDNIKTVWMDIADVTPFLENVETNPLLHQSMSYNDPVVLISFKAQVIEENTFVNMCISYRTFEKVADKLHAKNYDLLRKRQFSDLYTEDIEKVINHAKLNMSVLLGKSQITVNDFMELGVGDVIKLDTDLGKPLKLLIEDKQKLYVQPGLYKDKLSVQVVGEIGKDVGEDE